MIKVIVLIDVTILFIFLIFFINVCV